VFNRGFLDEFLDTAFQKSLRDGAPLSLGFIDLDHFKLVNDTHGHPVGDQVLKFVAEMFMSKVRASDLVGRYGGEEFMVVFPGTPAAGASILFHRILEALRHASHDIAQSQSSSVTASIGGATHSQEQPFSHVSALVTAADRAVYAAKDNGRNQYITLA
jgi:diguanylate cyclase (GGDEF)-like protein